MKRSAISKKSRTDWKRIDRMKDEDIDLSERPEIDAEMFARAVVRKGLKAVPRKEQLTLRIDSDELADLARTVPTLVQPGEHVQ